MTNVTMRRREEAGRVRVECLAAGHATGSPAVCAAVSALLSTLAGWSVNLPPGLGRISMRCDKGWFSLQGDLAAEYDEERLFSAVFSAVGLGLLQIARSYPEYLKADVRVEE